MIEFHCTACPSTGHFESFADANRFKGWTHVGESLICGECYLKRLAARGLGPNPTENCNVPNDADEWRNEAVYATRD